MSNGRPADLPFTGWATGNYPAGANPWNGQPKRVAPVNAYYEPAIQAVAQHDNYVIGALADAVQGMLDYLGQVPAYNWFVQENFVPGSYTTRTFIKKIRWGRTDPAYTANLKFRQGCWYAWMGDYYGGNYIGNGFLFRSDDGGATWNELLSGSLGASPSISQFEFAICPSGDVVFPRDQTSGGNSQLKRYSVSSGAVTDVTHNAASDTVWTHMEPRVDLVAGDGSYAGVLAIGSKAGTPYTTQAAYSNADGTTWTNITSKVPASQNTGAATTDQWFSIQSPGSILVFRTKTAEPKYAQITDITANWTERTSPLAAGQSMVAGCYAYESQNVGKFFLVVNTATDTKIYSSSDGTSFSLVSTITNVKFSSIEALNNLLVATSAGTGDAATDSGNLLWYSTDAGVTWNTVPSVRLAWDSNAGAQPNGVYTNKTLPKLAAARNTTGSYQLMAYNSLNALRGLTVGRFDNVNGD